MKFWKYLTCGLSLTACLCSCDCDHFEEPSDEFKVGWIVCTDGQVMPFCDYIESDKTGVAIVYNVNSDHTSEIAGYAVYLNDTKPVAFSDSLNVAQGTSADIFALDGNENTYAIYSTEDVGSPLADVVFDLWTYGQSAYVPSVAQLRQIHNMKNYPLNGRPEDTINTRLLQIGGDILPDAADDCWYWSSTEVSGQQDAKSWLFSMHSGALHETPKNQAHKLRAVITLYRAKDE